MTAEESSPACISCDRLVDGDGAVIGSADTVLVRDGLIVSVGQRASLEGEVKGDAKKLHFPGCTLMPGLVNAHDHMLFRRSTLPMATLFARSQSYQSFFGARNAALALMDGVTSSRDMAAIGYLSGELRDAVACGMIPGPTIVSCQRAITRPGGPGSALSIPVENDDQALAAVEQLVESRADFIKVFASTDGSSASQPVLDEHTIALIVKRASQHGLKTVAHATTRDSIKACINSGVFCVEHGPELDNVLAREMAANGMWFTPTMSGFWVIGVEGEKWGRPPHVISAFAACLKPHVAAVRAAVEEGVSLAVGTDSLGTMHMEIDLLSQAGVPISDIIRAATSGGAELLGLQSTGRLQNRYRADLLVLRGNPLEDISAFLRPELVVLRGREVETSVLSRQYCQFEEK